MDRLMTDFALERNIRMVKSCRDAESLQRVAIMLLQTNAALKSLLADSMLKEIPRYPSSNQTQP